ncbi:MAG: cobalt transporter CbiM [Caldiserica bacterium]|jgi:cobalt/nickel transport system permease protein|nr:cobalt transporter CbiM [Caldisericota bacterium]MDH7562521.1 cobalt transporter CbiM [Caldisericota bacterium]
MHIPDGYLGPGTYLVMYGASAPFWVLSLAKLKRTLKSKAVPLLAFGTAFIFIIMMFNVPIPGGTTGHAVGASLVTILLGPWAASLATSLVLLIQALVFGDGGITALGANCFTMGVIIPFSTWAIFRLLTLKSSRNSPWVPIAGGVSAYISLNLAALATGFLLGIQPLLYHSAEGKALYAPYPLFVAIPAMGLEHLLVFGWVEAVVTVLALFFVQKFDVSLISLVRKEETSYEGV